MKKFLKFIIVFIIIGLESLGNMSAVTAVLEENLIKKNKWITEEDLMDSITIARLGPGATTANMVAFLGNKIYVFWGGVIATICYIIAPLIIMLCAINWIDKVVEYPVVMSALRGSLACICVMFMKSTLELGKKVLDCSANKIIFGVGLFMAVICNISGVGIILGSICIGIVMQMIKQKGETNGNESQIKS